MSFTIKIMVMEIMEFPLKQISDDHKIWLDELDNHWNELVGFEHRLSRLCQSAKFADKALEHQRLKVYFQQLQHTITCLIENIKSHQHGRNSNLPLDNLLADGAYYKEHATLRKEVQTFRQLFLEVQQEYYSFLAKKNQ